MGVIMGAFSLASVLGIPLGLELANLYGWHAPFFAVGGLSVVMLFVVVAALPSMKEHMSGNEKRFLLDSFIHISNSPAQQLALWFMFALVLGQFTVIPYLSQSFVMNGGLPESQLSFIYLFGGMCSIVASPVVGRLADRFTKHMVFTISAMYSLILIFVITHLGEHPVWILIVVSSLFFIAMSGRMVPAMALISSTARPKHRGGFMSVVSAVQQFSAAIAAYIAGSIIVEENGHLIHFEMVGSIAIIFTLVAVILANRLPHGQQ